jgi:hypothetical protein
MHYFTPQLFLEINSSDDAVVERAAGRWEKAIAAYRKHLATILRGMPSELRDLGELSLHDWDVVNIAVNHRAATPSGVAGLPVWYSTASIAVRDGEKLLILLYVLWDKAVTIPAPENWSLSKDRVHWLYDELELASDRPDRLVHQILLSNGVTLVIPFSTCIVQTLRMDQVVTQAELLEFA